MMLAGMLRLFSFAVAVLIATTACAHHGPEHVIERLTEQLTAKGPDAVLYAKRAEEHNTINQFEEAAADYRRALEIAPDYQPAQLGLAKCELMRSNAEQALAIAKLGIESNHSADLRSPFYVVRAKALEQLDKTDEALASWAKAIEGTRTEVDWFLGHARCLANLGQQTAACDALRRSTERNPSIVLRRAWIESLVDCSDFATAEPLIEQGVERSRWKGTWLLLRARLRLQQEEYDQALADAQRAASEFQERLEGRIANPMVEDQMKQAEELIAAAESNISKSTR